MTEWLLIITVLWGDATLGGEGKYVGGPYKSVTECARAIPATPPRMTIGDGQGRMVKAECVLRDNTAGH